MPREFISEYGIDPEKYVQRLVEEYRERCPQFSERDIEEVVLVDDGPVDYLVWIAFEGYEEHTFFYHDDDPEYETIRELAHYSPDAHEMQKFKIYLHKTYETYEELDLARVLEIPDTYKPQIGDAPRAYLSLVYEPSTDHVVSGISASPRAAEQEIFEDVGKIVPDRGIEKFIEQTVLTVNERIKANADRHLVTGEIRDELEADPDFRLETTKPLPEGIHPQFRGDEAELWQKPASKVEYMDGSQGFLQIWIPVEEPETALVDATAGHYDRDAIIEEIRTRFEAGGSSQ